MDQAKQIINNFKEKHRQLKGAQFFIEIEQGEEIIKVTLFTNALRNLLQKELTEAGVEEYAEVSSLESVDGPEFEVTADYINLHITPNPEVIKNLADQPVRGEHFKVLRHIGEGEWTPVAFHHDYEDLAPIQLGYIIFDSSKVKPSSFTPQKEVKVFSEAQLLEIVDSYLSEKSGIKYLLGGKSLKDGMDCSSFTQEVFYKLTGRRMHRQSKWQMKLVTEVNPEDLKIGDMVFFFDKELNAIGHVGIVVELQEGNPKIINCTRFRDGIVIEELSYMTRVETALQFAGYYRI